MLKGAGEIKLNLVKTYNNENEGIYTIGKNTNFIHVTKTTTITAGVILTDYTDFWHSIKVTTMESGTLHYKTLDQLTQNAKTSTITLNNVAAEPYATICIKHFKTRSIIWRLIASQKLQKNHLTTTPIQLDLS